MLVENEEFVLVIQARIFYWRHQDIHHLFIHVNSMINIHDIYQQPNLERIIFKAQNEKLNKLVMSDFILLCIHEWSNIVFLTIHLKDNENIFSCNQKPFSVVLSNSLLNYIFVCYNNLFIICLIVHSVCWRF